ncbi:MAG: DUF424 family protein [Candidatus Woesearchaeota archaeon]
MIAKVHKTPNGMILALCDTEILGKTFEEGKLQLNLDSQFYNGEEISDEEVEKLLKIVYIVNAVGELAVGLLIKKGLVPEELILKIAEIPHVQCVVERT